MSKELKESKTEISKNENNEVMLAVITVIIALATLFFTGQANNNIARLWNSCNVIIEYGLIALALCFVSSIAACRITVKTRRIIWSSYLIILLVLALIFKGILATTSVGGIMYFWTWVVICIIFCISALYILNVNKIVDVNKKNSWGMSIWWALCVLSTVLIIISGVFVFGYNLLM